MTRDTRTTPPPSRPAEPPQDMLVQAAPPVPSLCAALPLFFAFDRPDAPLADRAELPDPGAAAAFPTGPGFAGLAAGWAPSRGGDPAAVPGGASGVSVAAGGDLSPRGGDPGAPGLSGDGLSVAARPASPDIPGREVAGAAETPAEAGSGWPARAVEGGLGDPEPGAGLPAGGGSAVDPGPAGSPAGGPPDADGGAGPAEGGNGGDPGGPGGGDGPGSGGGAGHVGDGDGGDPGSPGGGDGGDPGSGGGAGPAEGGNGAGLGPLSDGDAAADLIPENAAGGSAVGITAQAVDPDDAVSYALADDAGGRFVIDAASGVITVADGALLDREQAASHAVTVVATSADGSSVTQSYTIGVGDVNEFALGPISDANGAANRVSEGAAAGTAVGITALATDADATDNAVTYALVDSAGAPVTDGPFAIDAATGVVTVRDNALLEHDRAGTETIRVRAESADGSVAYRSFEIEVDGDPRDITFAAPAVIDPRLEPGTIVATATAWGQSAGDTITWSLAETGGGLFTIDATTGEIATARPGLTGTTPITVRATDSDGVTYEERLMVRFETPGGRTLTGTAHGDLLIGLGGVDGFAGGAGDDIIHAGTAAASDPTAHASGHGAVGYWDLAEVPVTGAGKGRAGTGAAPHPHSPERGATFDGLDDRATIGHDASHLLAEGSVQIWFRADRLDGDATLLAKGTGGQAPELGLSGDRLTLSLGGAPLLAAGGISADTWHHAVWSWDGSTHALHLDGVRVATGQSTATIAGNRADWQLGASPAGARFFDGTLDGFAVFDNALDPAAVADLSRFSRDLQVVSSGGEGDDTLMAGFAADVFDGGAGRDTVSYEGSAEAVRVDLGTGTASGGHAAGDVLTHVENVIGSSEADMLAGDAGANTLRGGAGDDILLGRDGDDVIHTGPGGDSVDGGEGSDIVHLHGGEGAQANAIVDTGSAGTDTLVLSTGPGTYRVQGDFSAASAGIEIVDGSGTTGDRLGTWEARAEFDFTGVALNGVDGIVGTDNADRITGSDGADSIVGGGGSDVLAGGRGDDRLEGGAGDDLFAYLQGDGADTVAGGQGWIDVIEAAGLGAPAEVGTSTASGAGWTLVLDAGHGIEGEGPHSLDLSADASGMLAFDDGGSIAFTGIESIRF